MTGRPRPHLHSVGISGLVLFVSLTATGCSGVEEPVPHDPAGPESSSRYDLVTTTERPLQQRLEMAFPDSYRDGVQIFWEPDDGWIDNDLLMFWRSRLQPEDLGGLNQQAAEKMFSEIPGQAPVFTSDSTRRICAVVGASGNLIGSRYGQLIDAHNVVFRVNRAPTDDFDDDVGAKTTHHVTWPRDLDQYEFDADAFLLMTPISTHMPDVFGFGADAEGRWDRYYIDETADPTGFHPGDFESDLRREMERRGILRVFRGSRSESGTYAEMAGRE